MKKVKKVEQPENRIQQFQDKVVDLCNKEKVVLLCLFGALSEPLNPNQSKVSPFFTTAPIGKHTPIIATIPAEAKEAWLTQLEKLMEAE